MTRRQDPVQKTPPRRSDKLGTETSRGKWQGNSRLLANLQESIWAENAQAAPDTCNCECCVEFKEHITKMVKRDTRKRLLIDVSLHEELMAQIALMEEHAHASVFVYPSLPSW